MINFASNPLIRRQRSNLVLVVILALVLLFMVIEHDKMQAQFAALSMETQSTHRPQIIQLPITEEDIRRSDLAEKIYGSLTFPWQTLFAGLEQVKQVHNKIHYKVLAPVKSETAILLTAQAESIQQMLSFIADIEANPTFSHARLINQNTNKDRVLEFTVKIGWAV